MSKLSKEQQDISNHKVHKLKVNMNPYNTIDKFSKKLEEIRNDHLFVVNIGSQDQLLPPRPKL